MFSPKTYTVTEEDTTIITKKGDKTVPEEKITLPAPFDNGIEYSTFTRKDCEMCINSVESRFPWIKGTYKWTDAKIAALKNRGTAFKYDGGAGYWRSSVYELVRDFWHFFNSGIDVRAQKLEFKGKKKIEKKMKRAVPLQNTNQKRKLLDVTVVSNSKCASSSNKNSVESTAAKFDESDNDCDDLSPCAPHSKKHKAPINEAVSGIPIGVPVAPPKLVNDVVWKPEIEDSWIRDLRMVISSSKLVDFLRNHPDGNYIQNPYQKLAGEHTMKKTKEEKKSHIKKVITRWLLNTDDGKRYLNACDLKEGEFTIDRVISRNGKSLGTNCVWNLYLMPGRVNSYFGECDDKKRDYVGEKAWRIATMANEVFHEQAEVIFDFEAACAKKATAIMLSVNM